MGIGYVIKQLRTLKGLSQRDLAKRAGVSQPTIAYLEKSDPDTSKSLRELAAALEVAPEEILCRAKNAPDTVTIGDEGEETFVSIPEYRVSFSAGPGDNADSSTTYEVIEDSEPKKYNIHWFQKRHINPDRCKRFKVSGDSMEPLLYDRDSVLVYQEPLGTPIRDGYVYVIRCGSQLWIKRLVRNLNGSITLKSVNPSYEDYVISPADVETQFEIIGRVVDKSGEGGLRG